MELMMILNATKKQSFTFSSDSIYFKNIFLGLKKTYTEPLDWESSALITRPLLY